MLAQLKQTPEIASEQALSPASHILFVLPADKPQLLPYVEVLEAKLKRSHVKYAELGKTPLVADLPGGGVACWVVLDAGQTVFQQQTAVRKALKPLLEEKPQSLSIAVYGNDETRHKSARIAVYVAWLNAAELPTRKGKHKSRPLRTITLHGWEDSAGFDAEHALAEGNTLARRLTMLPPNDLTPGIYRGKIRELAAEHGWAHEEYDLKKLRKLGAGAFVAVAQGSDPEDAAIVHLIYAPKKTKKTVALVGKGICFDTGGHNLKPARSMHGMHEDMNGSAVALGILLAATLARLPVRIDCWLALAQNHISPKAYKQNDVVTALNGTTIEIIHTDAEGRMVLADTLTLAARAKPDVMVDFATLTGSMAVALGDRYSGILGNRPELIAQAVAAGVVSGERVCAFPLDEDYDEALDSKIADVKQCTLEGEADHILAGRFLQRFVDKRAWLHVDLSSSNCKGGLGAAGSDVNGFGVGWGLALLADL